MLILEEYGQAVDFPEKPLERNMTSGGAGNLKLIMCRIQLK